MNVTLRVWRQTGPGSPGKLVEYKAADISPCLLYTSDAADE